MIISIIGPSGSGKDTQARFIEEKYNIPNISTGRLMREEIDAGSELGKKIDSYIGDGKWLPDDMTFDLLLKRVLQEDTNNGFLLNGFPRTYAQIELLDKISEIKKIKISAVVHFQLDDNEIIRRMRKQAQEAEQRNDIDEQAIRTRLKYYKDTISPIIEEYTRRNLVINIDASPSIEEVRKDIAQKLEQIIS
ncbi:nucleoside monophosphate kinase [Candidatus Dojkabacteria bacterium]|nr:nucleoside monophosphate kinase [Candidatus Dojkabacteria bacterium]